MTKRTQNVTGKEGRGGDGDLGIASMGVQVEEKKLDTIPEKREGERLRDQKLLGEPVFRGQGWLSREKQRIQKRSRRNIGSKEGAPA